MIEKSEKAEEYKRIIIGSFPGTLRVDVEKALHVLPLNEHYIILSDNQPHKVDSLIFPRLIAVQLDNETLKIPYRVYFNEPDEMEEAKLSELQKVISRCIYLRHRDGFIRQKKLEQLMDRTESLIIPFSFQFLGEYVVEILEALDKHINERTIEKYKKFINENKKYCQSTESRMISYWNEYYRRRFPKLNNYIGKRIVDRIKS